jgi:hypothetical protein
LHQAVRSTEVTEVKAPPVQSIATRKKTPGGERIEAVALRDPVTGAYHSAPKPYRHHAVIHQLAQDPKLKDKIGFGEQGFRHDPPALRRLITVLPDENGFSHPDWNAPRPNGQPTEPLGSGRCRTPVILTVNAETRCPSGF